MTTPGTEGERVRNGRLQAVLLVALAVAAGGCGWLRGDEAAAPVGGLNAPAADDAAFDAGPQAAPPPPAAGPTVVAVSQSAIGPVLVDGRGLTLYRFTEDQRDVSTCSGACVAQWPQLPWGGEVQAGAGLNPTAIRRIDGQQGPQVSCDGWPLYTFAGDQGPGQLEGHAVNGAWYAVSPDCQMLSQAAAR
jgi:predicted lipoprotein with Yx(FWY)xxD motif